jgi:hypothetical protein
MALAAIGTLPLPLMHRSILIEMSRATRQLKRFDSADVMTQLELNGVYRDVYQWAESATLSSDPPLPTGLANRPADNWRPLIAIADSVGGIWPEYARDAAMALIAPTRIRRSCCFPIPAISSIGSASIGCGPRI